MAHITDHARQKMEDYYKGYEGGDPIKEEDYNLTHALTCLSDQLGKLSALVGSDLAEVVEGLARHLSPVLRGGGIDNVAMDALSVPSSTSGVVAASSYRSPFAHTVEQREREVRQLYNELRMIIEQIRSINTSIDF